MQQVKTTYGTFIQKEFHALRNLFGKREGINIMMEFEPGDRVIDAEKIGFVQIAKTELHGKPERDLPQTDKEGYAIDQFKQYRNPLYATSDKIEDPEDQKKPAENESTQSTDQKNSKADRAAKKKEAERQKKVSAELEGYKADKPVRSAEFKDKMDFPHYLFGRKTAGYGAYGSRKVDASGKFTVQNAEFSDSPYISGGPDNSSQEFETTALVVDGWQTGLYLGSVNWGWERKGGKFTEKEIKLCSPGAPSEKFFAAAEKWNSMSTVKGKGSMRGKNVDLLMSTGKITADKADMFATQEDVGAMKTSKTLTKDTKCRIVDEAMINGESYLYVRSLNSSDKLAEGWVKESTVNSDNMFPKINSYDAH